VSWTCGQELSPTEDPFLTTEEGCVNVSQLLVACPLDTLRHQFHPFLAKMKRYHPLMGHPPPNHYVEWVMASLHPQIVFLHLMGRMSINLVVLAVVLLLDGEDFLICEDDVFVPVLGVPLEEMLCSCLLNLLQSRNKDISL